MTFVELAEEFCQAILPHVDEADAEEAFNRRVALVDAIPEATVSELNDGLDVLAGYVARYDVDDANRMANAAYIGGKLIEAGAEPRKLEVLLEKLPRILQAARRYADGILPHMPTEVDDDEPAMLSIDGTPIPPSVFYAHAEHDPAGRMCLQLHYMWMNPAVILLTRDRELLQKSMANIELQQSVSAIIRSECQFLGMLLFGDFDQTWHVVQPTTQRSFHIRVDGFVTNRAIFALIADALITQGGIPGTRNAPDVLSFLRGEAQNCETETVFCPFQFYTCKAGSHDWSTGDPPSALRADSAGWPIDIPRFEGRRLLILGPQPPEEAIDNSWPAGETFINLYDPHRAMTGGSGCIPFTSPFQRLRREVRLVHEVGLEETQGVLTELARLQAL
ncbi:hypothetical protein NQ176_g3297 [Zarea fungicola]|uniref:Uncharacterized protein n=1 Tax=Zarea fungicola TaxID=93591 RepID=A0ACC1NLY6_9HYPO|nr:hypothetical protein NQ176_g3297 [Lecanicillium fungicola]